MYLGYCRSGQDNCFFRCLFPVFVNPGTMLTNIGNLQHIWVHSRFLHRFAECVLMHTRGTGTYNNTSQMFFFDGLLDLRLSSFRTHILIIFRMNHARLVFNCFYHFFNVYSRRNVGTAVADKYSYSLQ